MTKASIRDNAVAVLGSGPSLVLEDIETLRAAGVPFVAVNSTWEIARDCRALVAGDLRWWKAHAERIDIDCLRISRDREAQKKFSARAMRSKVVGSYNSGMVAAEWLIQKRASLIILLGMDCSLQNGIHHHGSHSLTPDPTRHRIARWHRQWQALRDCYPQARIVNCSRFTELAVFDRRTLGSVLCELG